MRRGGIWITEGWRASLTANLWFAWVDFRAAVRMRRYGLIYRLTKWGDDVRACEWVAEYSFAQEVSRRARFLVSAARRLLRILTMLAGAVFAPF